MRTDGFNVQSRGCAAALSRRTTAYEQAEKSSNVENSCTCASLVALQMGSALSKDEACFIWCGMEDDSYPAEPMLNDDDLTAVSLTEDVALGTEVRLPYLLSRFYTLPLHLCPSTAAPLFDQIQKDRASPEHSSGKVFRCLSHK